MISVGSRDVRKGLGLRFGTASEMEEADLEEGEACSYLTDDYSAIDPDVALSYIDVKIQDVLGHFQKDFEGGVSAENLGAKFGGYGSFLPTYQRSPVWSHPKTPPKVQNSNAATSPNNLHLEGGHHKSVFPPSASLSVRYGQASETGSSLPLVRASVNDSEKRDAGVSFALCAEELTSGYELEKKYDQHSDPKSLKVLIKVGSDNLSTQKKAEIYSGLGLDLSPAPSSDYIPSDSEVFSRELKEGHHESPTSILQIMTSFPVHGNLLLSPLPDDLITLTEKERSHRESKPRFRQKDDKESSHRSDSGRSDEKSEGVEKPKLFQRMAHLVELKNLNNKGVLTDNGILLKKETDIESVDCQELVENSLKLRILSNSCSNVSDSTKSNARAVDDFRVVNNVKLEFLKEVSAQETGLVEKPSGKACSAGKAWEEKNANFNGDMSVYPRKDDTIKRDKGDIAAKCGSYVSKGRKSQNAESIDPLEQKISQKSTSLEADDMKLASGKENSSSGGKKKLKGSENHSAQGTEVPNESSRMDSSFVPPNRKSSYADFFHPESEIDDSKVHKDDGNASDRYRDFFGDIELEEEDNYAESSELLFAERKKDFEAVENSTAALDGMLNAISNGKKRDKPLASEAYSKAASSAAPIAENGSISDASPGTLIPVVKDDWVGCDKCQKWRLLPRGTNPDSFPEKWLCSMLYWLPGLNRCSVSEDETTKALISQYQIPAPVNQNNMQGHQESVLPLADANHFDQNCRSSSLHALPSGGGKKKNGVKDVLGPLSHAGLVQLSKSTKKNLQHAVKSSSLDGVNKSPLTSVIEPAHLSKSIVVKKSRPREKNKPLERHSDGGETRSSKIKIKTDNDQDSFRISKKTKIDGGMYCNNADLFNHGGLIGKAVTGSSSGNASRKDSHKYGDHSSKDGGCEANNRSKGPGRNPKDQVQGTSDDRYLDIKMENDEDFVSRKRKVNESHDRNIYIPSPRTGHHDHDRRDFIEQTSENLHQKEKRARVFESEGKDISVSRNCDQSARKARRTKDQQSGPHLTQRCLDGTDSLRRVSGSLQPSQEATSSSSKVSRSGKSQSNMQERKSSPVESVSSSPPRLTHPDTSALAKTSHEVKNDFGIVGLFATGTPRRGTISNDKWRDKSKTVKKDETSVTNSFAVDFLERDIGQLAGSDAKIEIVNSAELDNGGTDTLGNGTRHPFKSQASDICFDEGRGSDNKQYHANASHSRKFGKGSSSWSKDKIENLKTEIDKDRITNSDSGNKSIDHMPYEEKPRAGKNRVQEDFGANSDKTFQGKKEPAGKVISGIFKRGNQSKFGEVGTLDVKLEALSDKTDRAEVSGRRNSLPPSRRSQNALLAHSLPSNAGPKKEGGGNGLLNDGFEGGDALKAPKQNHKSDNQNENKPSRCRHATNNGHRVRDADAPSPARRDSSNPATNALKAAKDLKHLADRLKNSGSSAESTVLYFQAALKFLHGASLLESTNGESSKQSDMIQSMQIYSCTAKLCEFCAHEFEKSKDMAAAALAYKCTEVAYMRVVYSSRTGASRDRHELQSALQIVPHGESPSSSASDVDNVNNLATLDKVSLSKGVSSSQLAGNHASSAQNRPSFSRLLTFTQDVNSAMEASRKSRLSFSSANVIKEESRCMDGITSVKTALDFNFHDMDGLLHLVRLAMEAIGC